MSIQAKPVPPGHTLRRNQRGTLEMVNDYTGVATSLDNPSSGGSSVHEQRSRGQAYDERNAASIKVKRIANGYLVSEINSAPAAYPELGATLSLPEVPGVPTTVGEHVAEFFAKVLGEVIDGS